jgi:IS30 family transposase
VVERRTRYGDWEADQIEGARGTGYILSLYERRSRYGNLIKLNGKTSRETSRGIIKALGAEGYFCKPYSSWEKGGVENFNGLVRQYYPKGVDLSKVDQAEMNVTEAE